MQRPKQQALAFALGVLLTGAVVGFASYPLLHHDDTSLAGRRKAFYDDLGLAPAQRVAMDSLLDDRNCQFETVFKPVQPVLDSIRTATRAQIDRLLTPEQHAKLEIRRKEDDARKESERKRIQASCKR